MGVISKIKGNEFVKNVAVLSSGVFLAQLIPFLINPLIRAIIPDLTFFANYDIYFQIVTSLAIISSGRLGQAIIVPESDEESFDIYITSLFYSILFCAVIFLSIYIFKDFIISYLKVPNYVLFVIPVSVFFASNTETLNFLLVRKKQFKQNSISKVSQKSAENLFWLAFSWMKINVLFFGDILGRLMSMILNLKFVFQQTNYKLKPNLKFYISTLKKYKDYPIYNSLPSFLNKIGGVAIPLFIINDVFSKEETANFGLCVMLLGVPISLLSQSISKVFLQKTSELRIKKKSIKKVYQRIFLILTTISILIVLSYIFIAPYLIDLVYGHSYALSASYIQVLSFTFALKFIISPLSSVLLSLDKVRILSAWQTLYFFLVCTIFIFEFETVSDLILTFVCIESLAYIIYGVIINNTIKKYEGSLETL